MVDVVDLNKVRFDKAESCADINVATCLREALRQVETGEIPFTSVIVVGMVDDKTNPTYVDMFHGGEATTNDRLAMLLRAQHTMIDV